MQGTSFVFDPTATAINPSELNFDLKYKIKAHGPLTDTIMESNHSIEVEAFRSQSFVSI